jgi:hypothetical protein
MTGVVQGTATCTTSAGREWFGHVSAQLLLPAGAFASLLLGLGLLLDPLGPAGVYAPFVLFGVGAVALAAYLSLRYWGNVPAPSITPAPAARPAAISFPTNPRVGGGTGPSDRQPVPITGRGSEWRVLSAPASPGDETWLSWLPREHRRLGPEGGGVASGVVLSPGKAGNLVAFPVPNYYHGVRSAPGTGGTVEPTPLSRNPPGIAGRDDSITMREAAGNPTVRGPSRSSTRAWSFSEEELDRLFPLTSDHPYVVLTDAPERVGGVPSWKREAGPSTKVPAHPDSLAPFAGGHSSASGGEGDRGSRLGPFEEPGIDCPSNPGSTRAPSSGSLDSSPGPRGTAAELFLEAANPVPPHLRNADPSTRVGVHRPARRSVDPGSQRSVCASCSKVVVNLHMSGPCPKCLRPICNDCLHDAFARYGHGWCTDCSAASVVRRA